MAALSAPNVAPTWANMPGKACNAAAATGSFPQSACRKAESTQQGQGLQAQSPEAWVSVCHQAEGPVAVKICER